MEIKKNELLLCNNLDDLQEWWKTKRNQTHPTVELYSYKI